MRRLLLFVILFSILFSLLTPGASAAAQYSAFTRSFLAEVRAARDVQQKTGGPLALSESVRSEFLVKAAPGGDVVHGMIQVIESEVRAGDLERLGVTVNSQVGNIWTGIIPVESLEPLGALDGIAYIAIDSAIGVKLDAARRETKVASVHAGLNLPKAFTGAGVVVGVIDTGMDLLHPTFQDETGRLRISRVWHQDGTGTPPSGYSYGAEYSDPASIAALASTGHGSHGAHVTGIATGSGRNTQGDQFRGVAYEAEIVYIELGGGASAVTDAAKYIFDYAASVNKPAAINMSLGTHIGPHDGTSLQDQGFNRLSGPGKILVGAAGNEGSTRLHLASRFGDSGGTVGTLVQFEGDEPQKGTGAVDLWGSPNSAFGVALKVVDASGTTLAETQSFSSSPDNTSEGALNVGSEAVAYKVTSVAASATNQRPNIMVELNNATSQNVALFVTGAGTTVHAWNHGTGSGAAFVNLGDGGPFAAGDTDYTVGEIGGTAASVITVGAFTTKNEYTNFAGQPVSIPIPAALGEIAPFSSLGPTLDGRVKPDIAAPGNVIISAVQITDEGYDEGGDKFGELVLGPDNSSTGRYASQQGTSMASPMTAGIVALMLQARPTLTADQVRSIFDTTGVKDTNTGTIPQGGSNRWGRGKIDAYESVTKALQFVTPEPITTDPYY
ncbi:MAG: S8 family serine peptidase [Acidobacteria bacterium]|nr:S8 family serine peptidase [Acidobacteriota bacterium]